MSSPTIHINGADVHIAYVVLNTLWVVASFVMAALVAVQLRRLYVLTKRSSKPHKYYGLRVQWAHMTAIWVCLFVCGIDVSHVYFDESIYFGSLLAEVCVLTLNIFIFYFFSHVEAYILSNKSLRIPSWLPRARFYWMVTNFVGGTLCNIVTYVLQLGFLTYMTQAWVGIQAFVVAVVLGGLAQRLTRSVKEVFGNRTRKGEQNPDDALRKFKTTSVVSTLLGVSFGLALTCGFVFMAQGVDPAARFEDLPNTSPSRANAHKFSFFWLSWSSYMVILYIVKIFWIPRRVYEAGIGIERTNGRKPGRRRSTTPPSPAGRPASPNSGRRHTSTYALRAPGGSGGNALRTKTPSGTFRMLTAADSSSNAFTASTRSLTLTLTDYSSKDDALVVSARCYSPSLSSNAPSVAPIDARKRDVASNGATATPLPFGATPSGSEAKRFTFNSTPSPFDTTPPAVVTEMTRFTVGATQSHSATTPSSGGVTAPGDTALSVGRLGVPLSTNESTAPLVGTVSEV